MVTNLKVATRSRGEVEAKESSEACVSAVTSDTSVAGGAGAEL